MISQDRKELRRRLCPLVLVDHPSKGVILGPLFKDGLRDRNDEEDNDGVAKDAGRRSRLMVMGSLRRLVLDVALVSGKVADSGDEEEEDDELSGVVKRATRTQGVDR